MITFGLLLALAFFLPLNGNAQTPLFGERDGMRGAVRTVRSERARLSSGSGRELSRVRVDAIAYNKEGKRTERSIYNDYGFYVGRETYIYDSKGFLSQQTFYDANGSLNETRIYTNDLKGKTIRLKSLDGEGRTSLTQDYKHDINGNSVEEIIQNSTEVVGKRISKFDSKGKTTEVAYYDVRGMLQEKWLYGYDSETENPSWEALYNPDGSLKKKLVHLYEPDQEGNWIKRTTSILSSSPMSPFNESTFVTYRTITYY